MWQQLVGCGGSAFCGDILGRVWGGLEGRKNLGLLLVKSGCTNLVSKLSVLSMAAKRMEGRMDSMEEKMTEVQGEVQREIGAVYNELQRLGSLEKDVGTLLEKMEILDIVDHALQNMGESKHPSLSQGKLASRDTPILHSTSHALDPSGTSNLGEEGKVASNLKGSLETRGVDPKRDSLKEATIERMSVAKREDEQF